MQLLNTPWGKIQTSLSFHLSGTHRVFPFPQGAGRQSFASLLYFQGGICQRPEASLQAAQFNQQEGDGPEFRAAETLPEENTEDLAQVTSRGHADKTGTHAPR